MMRFNAELPSVKALNLMVVGEVVLDRYLWGTVERISPEAPIPVLRLNRSEERLGNAAFVAACVRALGAEAHLCGVIGADSHGCEIGRIARDLAIGCDSLLIDPARPTIVKERLLGAAQSSDRGVQQMLRVDHEDAKPLDATIEAKLLVRVVEEVDAADGVLVCDLNKGVLTRRLLGEIIRTARNQNKPVIVDPRRTEDFSIYRGATALTPNRFETQQATRLSLATPPDWPVAARKLVHDFDLRASLVTLDRDGMFLSERAGNEVHIETDPQEIYDVTGAGDVVLSVFGLFCTAGLPLAEAAALANVAASLKLSRQGATVISRAELANALRTDVYSGTGPKILSLHELRRELNRRRYNGCKVSFIDGTFDSLHAGHVRLLEFARMQADLLVVGLKHDRDMAQGTQHIQPKYWTEELAQMLATLPAVNYIVLLDDPTSAEIVRTIQPDVFIVTKENQPGYAGESLQLVREFGGRVVVSRAIEMPRARRRTSKEHSNERAMLARNPESASDDSERPRYDEGSSLANGVYPSPNKVSTVT